MNVQTWEKFIEASGKNRDYLLEVKLVQDPVCRYSSPSVIYSISKSGREYVFSETVGKKSIGNYPIDSAQSLLLNIVAASRNAKNVYIDKDLFDFGNPLHVNLLTHMPAFSDQDRTFVHYDKGHIDAHFRYDPIKEEVIKNARITKSAIGKARRLLCDYYRFNNIDPALEKIFPWISKGKNEEKPAEDAKAPYAAEIKRDLEVRIADFGDAKAGKTDAQPRQKYEGDAENAGMQDKDDTGEIRGYINNIKVLIVQFFSGFGSNEGDADESAKGAETEEWELLDIDGTYGPKRKHINIRI